jgi:hypothetical protein
LFDRLQLADLARHPLLASGELVDITRHPLLAGRELVDGQWLLGGWGFVSFVLLTCVVSETRSLPRPRWV